METVCPASTTMNALIMSLPLIFLVGSIVVLALAIRYFVRLGNDVKAIRQLLEDRKQEK